MKATADVAIDPDFVVGAPTYRVNIWRKSEGTFNLDAYTIREVADIGDVLLWVREKAGGADYELFVEVPIGLQSTAFSPHSVGLVRVGGRNPLGSVVAAFGEFIPTGGE